MLNTTQKADVVVSCGEFSLIVLLFFERLIFVKINFCFSLFKKLIFNLDTNISTDAKSDWEVLERG